MGRERERALLLICVCDPQKCKMPQTSEEQRSEKSSTKAKIDRQEGTGRKRQTDR